jgi:hypothetical protein
MQFIDAATQVIPGYNLLPDMDRKAFEATDIGHQFVMVINEMLSKVNARKQDYENSSLLSYLTFSTNQSEQDYSVEFKQKKDKIIALIQDSVEYQDVIHAIVNEVIKREYPDFQYLPAKERSKLAKAPFSQPLQSSFLPVTDTQLSTTTISFSKMQDTSQSADTILNAWKQSKDMHPFKKIIADKKAKLRFTQLAQLLPLLNNQQPPEPPASEAFVERYCEEYLKDKPNFEEMEIVFLTKYLLFYMKRASKSRFEDFNLEKVDELWAGRLAHHIRTCNDAKHLKLEVHIGEYIEALRWKLRQLFVSVNTKKEWNTVKVKRDEGLLQSFSYQFSKSKTAKDTKALFRQYARAHGFIQYTGFATQNESSWFAALDLINYIDSADQVNAFMAILASLLHPFKPLYEEYYEIGKMETSNTLKVFRALMPLLVATAFVVLVGAILMPIGVPEAIFVLVMIPALIIGLYLAAKYVSLKNIAYKALREYHYGGPYEIPEFQVNDRMTHIFGDDAERVRAIYIEELKRCDKLEESYSERDEQGILTGAEIDLRRKNNLKRATLAAEWYDIHSSRLGSNEVPMIVEQRLQRTGNKEDALMREKLKAKDMKTLETKLNDLEKELKSQFISKPSNYPARPLARAGGVPPVRKHAANSNLLFTSQENRTRLAEIDDLLTNIAPIRFN